MLISAKLAEKTIENYNNDLKACMLFVDINLTLYMLLMILISQCICYQYNFHKFA